MNTITITREAVCAADDMSNPLSITIELADFENLQTLVEKIKALKFLQFAPSSKHITGFASGTPIVKVHYKLPTEFLISQTTPAAVCLTNKLLEFKWI